MKERQRGKLGGAAQTGKSAQGYGKRKEKILIKYDEGVSTVRLIEKHAESCS